MHVVLKILSVKNVIVYIKWRTIDSWLGIARPIPSLTLLNKLL